MSMSEGNEDFEFQKVCSFYAVHGISGLPNLPTVSVESERRKSVRESKKVSTKVTRLKCSLLFNSTSNKEGILPTYKNFMLHNVYN